MALVVVSACGSDDGEVAGTAPTTLARDGATTTAADASTTTPPPTTTTTPPTTEPLTEEDAILAAVDGFWQTVVESSQPPDPDHPGLEQYLTGRQYEVTLDRIRHKLLLGQATRYPEDSRYSHSPELQSMSADSAVVADCGVDDLIVYDVASGRILNDAVSTTLWELRLLKAEGQWRVSESLIAEQWEGAVECASQ
jgi:hypothetical protein